MANVTIWHNPRCSKSRNAVTLLEEKGIEADVVKYLDTPPTKEELVSVLKMLGLSARELMRTKEDIYKELNLKDETDEDNS
jgi:arsenate reductase